MGLRCNRALSEFMWEKSIKTNGARCERFSMGNSTGKTNPEEICFNVTIFHDPVDSDIDFQLSAFQPAIAIPLELSAEPAT